MKIRTAIVENRSRWKRVSRAKALTSVARWGGESLKRPPRGFPREHPCLEDLKRKDFVVVTELKQKDATDADFMRHFAKLCKTYGPVVRFLCDALELPF